MRALHVVLCSVALGGCASTARPKTVAPPALMTGSQPSSQELPVDADDGVWGAALAPVSVVVFTDLECPYCAEGHALLGALQRRYGSEQLRIVVKHVPLRGHAGAIPAARVAQAVLELGGSAKFFAYLERAFAQQERVANGGALELALPLGLDVSELAARAGSARIGEQVLADVALAERLGVTALPHVRINGLGFTGVRPLELLSAAIESELAEVRRMVAAGVPMAQIYSRRVHENLSLPEPD